jgi:hypothetical protein
MVTGQRADRSPVVIGIALLIGIIDPQIVAGLRSIVVALQVVVVLVVGRRAPRGKQPVSKVSGKQPVNNVLIHNSTTGQDVRRSSPEQVASYSGSDRSNRSITARSFSMLCAESSRRQQSPSVARRQSDRDHHPPELGS